MIDIKEAVEAFNTQFPDARKGNFVDEGRLERRQKKERRASMTDRQLSRGGRARDVQLGIRTTQDIKALVAKLADKMGVGQAETIELAITELASRKGVKGDDA